MSGGRRAPRILHDLSPAIGVGSEVWPGDSPFHLRWSSRLDRGDAANVAELTFSPHTGVHADSPLHLGFGGTDASGLSLDRFCGPARVVDWRGRGVIGKQEIEELSWTGVERVLFRTRADGEPTRYDRGMIHFLPDAARYLIERGIRLVGIDTPSVDPFPSRELPAHRVLLAASVGVLESLEMSGVPAGEYELIALPLRLRGADASPVRAILRSVD